MNSPKSARKNPTMGQIDATVIEAGARQAYQAAAEAAEAAGVPLLPLSTPVYGDPKYNINIDARKVEAPVQQASVATRPAGLLAMVRSIPWYGWVTGGMLALFAAAVIGDVNEKPARASKNRARDDNDDDEDVDPNDDDLETLEDDEDFEDEEESEDEDADADDIGDSEDEEVEGDDDSEDEEIDADEAEDDEEDSVEQNRTPRKKPAKRERVIEDDQPDQKPAESAVGGRK
jgi:hypothetical protein